MTAGGGFGNAIVGTFVIVAIATLVSVPLGILAAIYITEFGPDTQTAYGGAFRGQGADRSAVDPGGCLCFRGCGGGDGRVFRPRGRSRTRTR